MSASFILCERTSRWAAAFRRESRKESGGAFAAGHFDRPQFSRRENSSRPHSTLPLQEVRSLVQCQSELEASPCSVVAVEVLPQNIAVVARSLSDWSLRFPHARFMVLAARGLEDHDLLMRESGALEVAYSPRKLLPLVRLIGRHLARAPKTEQTLEEAIWGGLPWS